MTKTVECDLHSPQPTTFVCQQIAESLHTGIPVGFFWPEITEEPRPNAWCAECNERVTATGGEWVGPAAESLGAKILCGMCYDKAKRLSLGDDA